jgi:hypothetical protein
MPAGHYFAWTFKNKKVTFLSQISKKNDVLHSKFLLFIYVFQKKIARQDHFLQIFAQLIKRSSS